MIDVIDIEEQIYIKYIENNKDFLKAFHKVYYNKYKEYLKGYRLSDYMITSYVKVNKVVGYENYKEFIEKYLLQIAEETEEATGPYEAYYNCFVENMEKDIKYLLKRFNKTEEDIYIAYEIKTLWQFYTGFLNEKVLTYYIDNYSCYRVAERTLEDKIYIDDNYAIDIEVVDDSGGVMAIQCKSYTYINISEDKKQIHINKHNDYRNTYENSNTYYILHKDYEPCYYMEGDKPCYLIRSMDVLDIKQDDIHKGTYEGMINQMKGMNECGSTIVKSVS